MNYTLTQYKHGQPTGNVITMPVLEGETLEDKINACLDTDAYTEYVVEGQE